MRQLGRFFLQNYSAPQSLRSVAILAGPGRGAFNESHIQFLEHAMRSVGAKTVMGLGDGETPFSNALIQTSLKKIKQETKGEDVTLLLSTHGYLAEEGSHNLDFSEYEGLSSEDFFNTVAQVFNKPVDILMTACHGASALSKVHNLPPNSTVVALSQANELTRTSDVWRFAEHMRPGDFSARHLLNLYLGSLENRISPSIAVSGGETRRLDDELSSRIGMPFSTAEKSAVLSSLIPLMEKEKIENTMDKISNARHVNEITKKEFGPALAVSLAAREVGRPERSSSKSGKNLRKEYHGR